MWDLFFNLGGLVAGAIILAGAVLSLFLLDQFIGAEFSVFIGVVLSAYPAFLVYRKIG